MDGGSTTRRFNLEVEFPEAEGSFSIYEEEKNRRMAGAYLERK